MPARYTQQVKGPVRHEQDVGLEGAREEPLNARGADVVENLRGKGVVAIMLVAAAARGPTVAETAG